MIFNRGTYSLAIVAALSACSKDESSFRGNTSTSDDQQIKIKLATDAFSDRFVQGADAEPAVESFVQGETFAPVDIVIVVDDSGSMSQEQANLSNGLSNLLSGLSNTDWQVVVTTTSANYNATTGVCARADSIFEKSDRNAAAKFKALFNGTIGIAGSAGEAGLFKATEGLSGVCIPKNWVRPTSTLAVLIVSDEENCDETEAQGCGPQQKDPMFLDNYLTQTMGRTVGVNARTYGFVSFTGDGCTDAQEKSTVYPEVITRSGGTYSKICGTQQEYKTVLDKISADIAKLLENQFSLSRQPKTETVTVSVNGQTIDPSKYEVTSTGIRFKEPPAKGAKIDINYQPKDGAPSRKFTLSQQATKEGIEVLVDGVVVAKDQYNVIENGTAIEFTSTPGLDSEIIVNFDPSIGQQLEFKIQTKLDKNLIRVFIAGAFVDNWTYDPVTGMLLFESLATDATEIIVYYPNEL